jgi:hypothetical protein
MTWEAPNATALVKGCVHPKPAFVDGGWIDTFALVRDWEGVYSKRHHWNTDKVTNIQVGCDTKIEWMLLERDTFLTPFVDGMPAVTYYVAFNAEYEMKALTIVEGVRTEFEINDINHWKAEIYNSVK